MKISLSEVQELIPGFQPSKGSLYVIGPYTNKFDADEQVVIGNYVYQTNVTNNVDPEGYRYGLSPVMSFEDYFYIVKKDLLQTLEEIIDNIYREYKDIFYWFNPLSPYTTYRKMSEAHE